MKSKSTHCNRYATTNPHSKHQPRTKPHSTYRLIVPPPNGNIASGRNISIKYERCQKQNKQQTPTSSTFNQYTTTNPYSKPQAHTVPHVPYFLIVPPATATTKRQETIREKAKTKKKKTRHRRQHSSTANPHSTEQPT